MYFSATFSSSEVRPAQTLAEAIAEVVSELNERQNGLSRQVITGDIPATDDEPIVSTSILSLGLDF